MDTNETFNEFTFTLSFNSNAHEPCSKLSFKNNFTR
jgi:hypothetical protein